MILIFTSSQDYSAKVVCEWLDFLKISFIRLNVEIDDLDILQIKFNSGNSFFDIEIGGRIINSTEITSVWYRGGAIRLRDFIHDQKALVKRENFKDYISYFLSSYSIAKLEFIVEAFKRKKPLGENATGRYNKLNALILASKSNLDIPATIVTTSKKDLLEFYKEHNSLINKSLDINFKFTDLKSGRFFHQYTTELSFTDIQNYPDEFPLTLFQEKIEKKYEIRVFYIDGKCYSMAILSQLNDKTKIDCRRYDNKNMNRVLTFKLPIYIENKIHTFMQETSMRTGSIDIIRSRNDKFIFLEVNPIGQFGYVSNFCNYYLEAEIATALSHVKCS